MNQNESRKANSAEAQNPKAPVETDFVGQIRYIQEKGEGLSRYSDKLRKNLSSIANIFGETDCCQICGRREPDGDHASTFKGKGQYSDQIFKAPEWHTFKAKIDVAFEIYDVEPFRKIVEIENYGSGEANFFLALLPGNSNRRKNYGGLLVIKTYENTPSEEPQPGDLYMQFADECSRETLKAIVKSGRLQKFLAYAASKIAEAEQEYKQVAEVAEKMAKAIEPTDPAKHTNEILAREGNEETGQ